MEGARRRWKEPLGSLQACHGMYPKVPREAANDGQEERSNHAPPAHNHVCTRNLSALVEYLGILRGGCHDRVLFGGILVLLT